jgi:uncharacterized protein YegL
MNLNSIIGRPQVYGWELRTAIEQALPRITQALDIASVSVIWNPQATTASIDNYGIIYLPMVADDAVIGRTLVVRYVGYIVHELLHRKYTDFKVRGKTDYIARMHNAVEDVWIEREAVRSGLLGNIEALLGGLISGIVDEALAQKIDWANPAQFPFSFAVFGRQYAAKKIPIPHNLLPIYNAANARIDACKSSTDTLAVAQWIIDQIQQQDNKPQDRKPQAGEQGDGTPRQSDQQGQDGQQGDQQGQDAGQDSEGDGAGQGDDQGDDVPDAGKSKPMGGKHDKPIEVEPGIAKQKGNGNRGTYSRDQTVLRDEAHIRGGVQMIIDTAAVSARLTMDIRKMFENSASDDWQMHRRTGSIDTRALAVGGANMFKRRLENAGIDSSVVILLDVSASMFGMPNSALINPAAGACIALMSALDSAGVESALLSFGSEVSTIKPFGKNSKRAASLLPRLGDGGGTNDYTALLHAHSLLHTRQTARKVCFVLTDGEGNTRDTKAQATSGENLGITTIGIGIQHDVSHVYKHAIKVNRAADLGKAMFSKIKGVL